MTAIMTSSINRYFSLPNPVAWPGDPNPDATPEAAEVLANLWGCALISNGDLKARFEGELFEFRVEFPSKEAAEAFDYNVKNADIFPIQAQKEPEGDEGEFDLLARILPQEWLWATFRELANRADEIKAIRKETNLAAEGN